MSPQLSDVVSWVELDLCFMLLRFLVVCSSTYQRSSGAQNKSTPHRLFLLFSLPFSYLEMVISFFFFVFFQNGFALFTSLVVPFKVQTITTNNNRLLHPYSLALYSLDAYTHPKSFPSTFDYHLSIIILWLFQLFLNIICSILIDWLRPPYKKLFACNKRWSNCWIIIYLANAQMR